MVAGASPESFTVYMPSEEELIAELGRLREAGMGVQRLSAKLHAHHPVRDVTSETMRLPAAATLSPTP